MRRGRAGDPRPPGLREVVLVRIAGVLGPDVGPPDAQVRPRQRGGGGQSQGAVDKRRVVEELVRVGAELAYRSVLG